MAPTTAAEPVRALGEINIFFGVAILLLRNGDKW
jgi:hypothetical protein